MQYRLLLTFLLLSPLYLSAMDMDDEIGGGFEDRDGAGVGSINGDGALTTPLLAGLPAADDNFRPATPAHSASDNDDGDNDGSPSSTHRSIRAADQSPPDAPPAYASSFQARLVKKVIDEKEDTLIPSFCAIFCGICCCAEGVTLRKNKTSTVKYVYDDHDWSKLRETRYNAAYYAQATSMGYEVQPVHGSYPWDPNALTFYPKKQK